MDLPITSAADANGNPLGRFICPPHPSSMASAIRSDLRPGESLDEFLHRHVAEIDHQDWVVSIGGGTVPRSAWPHVYPKHGQMIEARGAVGRSAMSLVAQAALLYFTLGLGSATAGWWGAGAALKGLGAAAATGVYMAGSIGLPRSIR